jgi:hypothetical protein
MTAAGVKIVETDTELFKQASMPAIEKHLKGEIAVYYNKIQAVRGDL